LIIILNVLRYVIAGPIEMLLVANKMFAVMQKNFTFFNTKFTTVDWVTSYFYNFMMWLTIVWVFHLTNPLLRGGCLVKSLKVFGIMFLFFASLSAIYMNHYSHTRDFYVYSIFDGLIVFSIVAIANGLIYPGFFRERAEAKQTLPATNRVR
jgi:hypothetical protein